MMMEEMRAWGLVGSCRSNAKGVSWRYRARGIRRMMMMMMRDERVDVEWEAEPKRQGSESLLDTGLTKGGYQQ